MVIQENSKIPDYSKELEDRVSANADALITIGLKEWYKIKRKGGKMKPQEDQVREIEDKLVEPNE